jgi:small-conductance mechanosensitive channel
LAIPCGQVSAQSVQAPDMVRAEMLEEEALRVLGRPVEAGDYAKINELIDLRERLAKERDRAKATVDASSAEIRLLQARLEALGPAPTEGDASDSAGKANLREELQAELATAELPIVQWQDVESTARALVAEVDRRIHAVERQRRLIRAQSPLMPDIWLSASRNITSRAEEGWAGLARVRSGGEVSTTVLFGLLALLVVAGVPYGCYRIWIGLKSRFEARILRSRSILKKIGFSILEDAISAIVAVIAVALALSILGFLLAPLMSSNTFEHLGSSLLFAGLTLTLVVWLGQCAFLSPIRELRLINLEDELAGFGFRLVRRIGVLLLLVVVVAALERDAGMVGPATYLASGLLVIIGSVQLWRLASLISLSGRNDWSAKAELSTDQRGPKRPADLATFFGHLLRFMAITAILAVLAGYGVLARVVLVGALLSLGTIAIAFYLQRVMRLVMSALADGPLQAYRKLLLFVPLATDITISISAIVIIAVVWGYTLREVVDAMIALRDGISFGDIRFSIGDVFTFSIVFALGYGATRWLQRYLKGSILSELVEDRGARSAIISGLGYVGITTTAALALAATSLDLTQLAFVAGALSVGLGFGLQSVVENFTSGIVLLIERPIKEGDWIEVGEHSGIVRKISVRSTRIETFDRHHIIIPNSQLTTNDVKNLSFGSPTARIIVEVGVAYSSDMAKVKEVLLKVAEESPNVLSYPEPFVVLAAFGDSSINMRLMCFVSDVTKGPAIRSELNFDIVERFSHEGIVIPFPQRTLHIEREAGEIS